MFVVEKYFLSLERKVKLEDIDIPKDYDLVIVDEAQHYPARTWTALVNHFSNSNRLIWTVFLEDKE